VAQLIRGSADPRHKWSGPFLAAEPPRRARPRGL